MGSMGYEADLQANEKAAELVVSMLLLTLDLLYENKEMLSRELGNYHL